MNTWEESAKVLSVIRSSPERAQAIEMKLASFKPVERMVPGDRTLCFMIKLASFKVVE